MAELSENDKDGPHVMCGVHSWRDGCDREPRITSLSVVALSGIAVVWTCASFLSESRCCSAERQHSKTQTIVAGVFLDFLFAFSSLLQYFCYSLFILPKGSQCLLLFSVSYSKQSKYCLVFVVDLTITCIQGIFFFFF